MFDCKCRSGAVAEDFFVINGGAAAVDSHPPWTSLIYTYMPSYRCCTHFLFVIIADTNQTMSGKIISELSTLEWILIYR